MTLNRPDEPRSLLPNGQRLDGVEAAVTLAGLAHADQTDAAGNPYMDHVAAVGMMVVLAGGTPHQLMAAYLHGVIGRGMVGGVPVTRADLDRAGLPLPVLLTLDALTRRPCEPLDTYLDRVLVHPPARLVKRCDVAHSTDPYRFAQLRERDEDAAVRRLAESSLALSRLDPDRQYRQQMVAETAQFALRAASGHTLYDGEVAAAVALLVWLHGMDGVATAIMTWIDAVRLVRRPANTALVSLYRGRQFNMMARWAVRLVAARAHEDDAEFTAMLNRLPDNPEHVGEHVGAVLDLCGRYLARERVTHG